MEFLTGLYDTCKVLEACLSLRLHSGLDAIVYPGVGGRFAVKFNLPLGSVVIVTVFPVSDPNMLMGVISPALAVKTIWMSSALSVPP